MKSNDQDNTAKFDLLSVKYTYHPGEHMCTHKVELRYSSGKRTQLIILNINRKLAIGSLLVVSKYQIVIQKIEV